MSKKRDKMTEIKYTKGDLITANGYLVSITEYKDNLVKGKIHNNENDDDDYTDAEWNLDGETIFLGVDCHEDVDITKILIMYNLEINLKHFSNFYLRDDGEIVVEPLMYPSKADASSGSKHYMSHNRHLIKYMGSSKVKMFPKFYED